MEVEHLKFNWMEATMLEYVDGELFETVLIDGYKVQERIDSPAPPQHLMPRSPQTPPGVLQIVQVEGITPTNTKKKRSKAKGPDVTPQDPASSPTSSDPSESPPPPSEIENSEDEEDGTDAPAVPTPAKRKMGRAMGPQEKGRGHAQYTSEGPKKRNKFVRQPRRLLGGWEHTCKSCCISRTSGGCWGRPPELRCIPRKICNDQLGKSQIGFSFVDCFNYQNTSKCRTNADWASLRAKILLNTTRISFGGKFRGYLYSYTDKIVYLMPFPHSAPCACCRMEGKRCVWFPQQPSASNCKEDCMLPLGFQL